MEVAELLEILFRNSPQWGFCVIEDTRGYLKIQSPTEEEIKMVMEAEAKERKRAIYTCHYDHGKLLNNLYMYNAEIDKYSLIGQSDSFLELQKNKKVKVLRAVEWIANAIISKRILFYQSKIRTRS
jgi:hypothetical protein